MRYAPLSALVLIAIFMVLPSHGWAADTTTGVLQTVLTMPPKTDWFRHLLSLALPGVGPLDSYSSDPAYTGGLALIEAATAWVSVLMACGVGIMSWHTISGMVATAYEGETLGKRWHTTWAPVRIVFGTGMLAPAIKGVCLAQVLVITVALYGDSLGNLVWSTYVGAIVNPSTAAAPALPATGQMVRDFAEAEGCWSMVHAVDAISPLGSPLYGAAYNDVPATWPTAAPSTSTYDNVGVFLGNLWNGLSASVNGGSSSPTAATARVMLTWDYGLCGQIKAPFATGNSGDVAVLEFDRSRLAAIETMRAGLHTNAEWYAKVVMHPELAVNNPTLLTAGTAALVQRFNAEKTALDQAFYSAGQTLVNGTGASGSSSVSDLQNAASQYGWMTAGTFYFNASMLQSRASQLAGQLPTLDYSKALVNEPFATDSKALPSDFAGKLQVWNNTLDASARPWNAGFDSAASSGVSSAQVTPDLSSAALAGADGNRASSVHSVNGWLFRSVYKVVERHLVGIDTSGKSGSEISQLSAFGNDLLNVVGTIVLGGGLVAVVTGGIGAIATAAVMMSTGAGSLVGVILVGMFLIGCEHAYLLPMLPYVEVFFASVQILLLVLEAFIAAPLWALMFIRMDGSEFINEHQRPGSVIVFNLFLRIPLTVFGLLLWLQLVHAGFVFLNWSFYPAMLSATSDGGPGAMGAIAMLVIVSWMHWHLFKSSLEMCVRNMPRQVARWMGADADVGSAPEGASHMLAGVIERVAGSRGVTGKTNAEKAEASGGATAAKGGGEVQAAL